MLRPGHGKHFISIYFSIQLRDQNYLGILFGMNHQGPRIDFGSGRATSKLHQFLDLGYTSCMQKELFSDTVDNSSPPP